jgi:copper chaperone
MKRRLFLGLLLLSVFLPSLVFPSPGLAEVTLKIEGMTCLTCAYTVRRALQGLGGVAKAEVSLEKGEARVQYDPQKVTVEAMIEAVKKAGFQASLLSGRR